MFLQCLLPVYIFACVNIIPHFSNKMFNCQLCVAAFSERGSLVDHVLLVHSRYLCKEIGCGSSFKTKPILRQHTRAKHQGTKYQCTVCGTKYAQYSTWYNHKSNIGGNINCVEAGYTIVSVRDAAGEVSRSVIEAPAIGPVEAGEVSAVGEASQCVSKAPVIDVAVEASLPIDVQVKEALQMMVSVPPLSPIASFPDLGGASGGLAVEPVAGPSGMFSPSQLGYPDLSESDDDDDDDGPDESFVDMGAKLECLLEESSPQTRRLYCTLCADEPEYLTTYEMVSHLMQEHPAYRRD